MRENMEVANSRARTRKDAQGRVVRVEIPCKTLGATPRRAIPNSAVTIFDLARLATFIDSYAVHALYISSSTVIEITKW
jgi:hypothetical protein